MAQLSEIEIASSLVLGRDPAVAPLVPSGERTSGREALERVILSALQREPCLVSFSGGRDSSSVLAVATKAAREHGLPLPIPVTLRFPGVEEADETTWQELVVRHLELREWHRPTFSDELDVVGPIATGVLRDHGLLWPFNTHFHVPVFREGRGGSVLTGAGGDEVLSAHRFSRVFRLLRAKAWPRRSDVALLAAFVSPQLLRARYFRRSGVQGHLPWLVPAVAHDLDRTWRRAVAREPRRWDRWVLETFWPDRRRAIVERSLDMVAADHDVVVAHPLSDPRFLIALASEGGRSGFPSRTHAMRFLFADVLPDELLRRPSKAGFDRAFWTSSAREFAGAWQGAHVDPQLVDVEVLRRLWTSGVPPAQTMLLFQAVWMKSHGLPLRVQSVEEPIGRLG